MPTIERKKKTIEVWNVCECGQILYSMHEGQRGQCGSCWMKAMPSDTKSTLNKLIGAALRRNKPTDSQKNRLIDNAMSKLDRDAKAQPPKQLEKQELVFLLDVDGVVCNFIDGIIKTHSMPITHDEFISRHYYREFGISNNAIMESINDGKWWMSLDEYPWAKRLVLELRRLGSVIFCTASSIDATCPSQKIQWLRDHKLMHESKNDYQIGKRKELNARSGAILIDDSDDNVSKFIECGGTAILFPMPWNQNASYTGDKVDHVLNQIAKMNNTHH